MAKVVLNKKKNKGKGRSMGSIVGQKMKAERFVLPEEATLIANNLSDYSLLLYGAGKIGKTSLLSYFNEPYFAMFDPLKRGMALKQSRVKDWDTFLKLMDSLEANPGYCRTVVLDTGYEAYDKCYQWTLRQFGVESFEDAGFGFWKEVEREFKSAHARIMDMGLGLIATAHCDEEEVTKHGMTRHVTTTQLGKQATRYYTAEMDIIAYYYYDDEGGRWLQIQGDSGTLAGTRTEGRFLYTDGTPVKEINMGHSAKEAYGTFQKAFNCELINPDKKGGKAKFKLSLKK